jgi:hypothetical protein
MKLPGDEEQGRMGIPVVYMVVGVSLFVLLILFAVLKDNSQKSSGSEYLKQMREEQEEEQLAEEEQAMQEETAEPKLRAEDLDFWDMYPVDGEDETTDSAETAADTDTSKSEDAEKTKSSYAEKAEKERQELQQEAEDDPSTDGKHTLVTNSDGTEEWVLLNPYLTKNTYDFTKLDGKRKEDFLCGRGYLKTYRRSEFYRLKGCRSGFCHDPSGKPRLQYRKDYPGREFSAEYRGCDRGGAGCRRLFLFPGNFPG